MKHSSRIWKVRLIVGIIMVVLAFLGMVVTDVRSTGGWNYWKWIVPIYALLALWLSWYVKRGTETISPVTVGHELLHWLGVIGTIFLVSSLVNIGTISRFAAGIFQLILLSLGVFLAGIYIESILLLVGIVLGIFAVLIATLSQYLYSFIIPIAIGGILILLVSAWISHKKATK